MEEVTRRENWVDSLKGIAILGVVMIHSGCATMPSPLGELGAIGTSGVQMFFLLSSYLAFKSYTRQVEIKGNTAKSYFDWLIKRIIRLLPLFYLALLCGIVRETSNSWSGNSVTTVVGNISSHIAFIHGFFPRYIDSIIGVEWYIGTLIIFCLCMPTLFRKIDSIEKALSWFLLSGSVCYIISALCRRFLVPDGPDAYVYHNYWGNFSFIAQFPVWLLGIVLYYVFSWGGYEKLKNKRTFSYVLLIIALIGLFGMMKGTNVVGISAYTIFGVLFFVIAISQQINPCVLIDNKIFRFLGRHSYPIYLFHIFLIQIYEHFVPNFTNDIVWNWIIEYFFVILASIVLIIPLERLESFVIKRLLRPLNS